MLAELTRRAVGCLPPPLLRLAGAATPQCLLYGPRYGRTRRSMAKLADLPIAGQQDWILRHMRAIVSHAVAEIPFYADLYREHGFHVSELRSLGDIARIPVVTKDTLRNCPLERRSSTARGIRHGNTGGTSGRPLDFLLSRGTDAIEMAHMHGIWRQLGYASRQLKLSFRGQNLGTEPLIYAPRQNEYVLNTYLPLRETGPAVLHICRRRRIGFLHGYPSTISEFAAYCETDAAGELPELLRASLRGVLLSSEYPAPVYRKRIEDVFGVPTVSWYGHGERALLACERADPYLYEPMQSYGYCEAVKAGDGREHLVGTSYFNLAGPFIRYDTEDIIRTEGEQGGILTRFAIEEGRLGEFVVDRRGTRISLTALIFGRHHAVFDWASHVQIAQAEPGRATVLVAAPRRESEPIDWAREFDGSDVDIEFDFKLIGEALRTPAGKVPLLVRPEMSS